MKRIDLHNHTIYCNHASGSIEEYIDKAGELNIDVYGFSCHAPMKFDSKYRMSLDTLPIYIEEIYSLDSDMQILCGLEVDYIDNKEYLIEDKVVNADVDYLIGSVHFLDTWGFDNPEFLDKWRDVDIESTWKAYINSLRNMVKTGLFDIVGHIDLLKIFGARMPSRLKYNLISLLEDIKKHEMVIEINQAGLRKDIGELYPSRSILEIMKELDINITFGSDAHSISQVGYGYEIALNMAKEIGFTKQAIFKKRNKILLDL